MPTSATIATTFITPTTKSSAMSGQQHPTQLRPCRAPVNSAAGSQDRRTPQRASRHCARNAAFQGVSSQIPSPMISTARAACCARTLRRTAARHGPGAIARSPLRRRRRPTRRHSRRRTAALPGRSRERRHRHHSRHHRRPQDREMRDGTTSCSRRGVSKTPTSSWNSNKLRSDARARRLKNQRRGEVRSRDRRRRHSHREAGNEVKTWALERSPSDC